MFVFKCFLTSFFSFFCGYKHIIFLRETKYYIDIHQIISGYGSKAVCIKASFKCKTIVEIFLKIKIIQNFTAENSTFTIRECGRKGLEGSCEKMNSKKNFLECIDCEEDLCNDSKKMSSLNWMNWISALMLLIKLF